MKKDSMPVLVKVIDEVPVVSTLDMWKPLEVNHKSIMSLLKKYESKFQETRLLTFEMSKGTGGRFLNYCYLDEEQASFLITLLRNSDPVVNFKRRLTREFFRMRKALSDIVNRKANAEWLEQRVSGKLIRNIETDTLKVFVEYATKQGSTNARHYYSNISTMQNKALFFIDQKFKNIRDLLDIHQLATIQIADRIVVRALEDGMARELHYKEIYQLAKTNIETFAAIHGKSPVPVHQFAHTCQRQLAIA